MNGCAIDRIAVLDMLKQALSEISALDAHRKLIVQSLQDIDDAVRSAERRAKVSSAFLDEVWPTWRAASGPSITMDVKHGNAENDQWKEVPL